VRTSWPKEKYSKIRKEKIRKNVERKAQREKREEIPKGHDLTL